MFVVVEIFGLISDSFVRIFPTTVVLGIVFAILAHFWACNPAKPWWRKRELATDVIYWFVIPLVARFTRIGLMIQGAAWLYGIHGSEAVMAFYDNGFGPFAVLPLWLQAFLFVAIGDFCLYWIHRLFHDEPLWKYHAVHHSSEEIEWISAARFHPLNIIFGTVMVDAALLLAGISPNVMLWVGPFQIAHSAFVHANLNWTLGPLRYVIATPVFHRWHHTRLADGGMTNFAGTFPIWDMMFGTYRMPKGELPENYGAEDTAMPMSFDGQMAYPFRQQR